MSRTALVIGGTGPTGPHVLNGLLARGFDVTIFHRGTHEPSDLPDVRHIHGDPHFRESIDEAVGTGEYDAVIAAYGRTKHLAASFRGRAGHFISIGGPPRYAGFYEAAEVPSGAMIPLREDSPLVDRAGLDDEQTPPGARFGAQLVEAEAAVFDAHPEATHLVYPVVYGPRNVIPWEWSIIKRVADRRRVIPLPDDGYAIHSRGAPQNLAHLILLALDQPEVAGGQVYNGGDDVQYSLRQWVELLLSVMGADAEVVGVPSAVAPILKAIYIPTAASICAHSVLDISKARAELGYRDVTSPEAVLAESVDWYRANPVDSDGGPSGFVDQFDYELEDRILASWWSYLDEVEEQIPQYLPADVHPMPHPKRPNQLVDERSR